MVEIETSIDYQADLTVHIIFGEVTSQEISDKLDAYYKGKTTKLILWDSTEATWASINSPDLRKMVIQAKKYSREGGKTAFVFKKDVDYGIGRMLKAYAEIENYDYAFGIFRNKEDAKAWLGLYECIALTV